MILIKLKGNDTRWKTASKKRKKNIRNYRYEIIGFTFLIKYN